MSLSLCHQMNLFQAFFSLENHDIDFTVQQFCRPIFRRAFRGPCTHTTHRIYIQQSPLVLAACELPADCRVVPLTLSSHRTGVSLPPREVPSPPITDPAAAPILMSANVATRRSKSTTPMFPFRPGWICGMEMGRRTDRST